MKPRAGSMVKQCAGGLAMVILTAVVSVAAGRRVPVPSPVLFMYGYVDTLTGKPDFWPSQNPQEAYDTKQYKAVWEKTIRVLTVIEGTTQDAELVKRLRSQGKVFAYHVVNTVDEKHKTVDDFVSEWSQPFENTLGGKLAGGFDAISIDEFHSYPDGSKESLLAIEALRQVREAYPDRLIFASGVWKLADGGPDSLYGSKRVTYDDTLNAIQSYSDVFVLENYQRTGGPHFELFEAMAKNIETRSPGLLKRAIFALYVSQAAPFIADDDPKINFAGFLDMQLNLIKLGKYTRMMPGVAYWVFYRSKPRTIEKVIELTEKDYWEKLSE